MSGVGNRNSLKSAFKNARSEGNVCTLSVLGMTTASLLLSGDTPSKGADVREMGSIHDARKNERPLHGRTLVPTITISVLTTTAQHSAWSWQYPCLRFLQTLKNIVKATVKSRTQRDARQ